MRIRYQPGVNSAQQNPGFVSTSPGWRLSAVPGGGAGAGSSPQDGGVKAVGVAEGSLQAGVAWVGRPGPRAS